MSTTLRSSSFGWLTPVSRTKSVELGVSSEALAKEDWFEITLLEVDHPSPCGLRVAGHPEHQVGDGEPIIEPAESIRPFP